MPAQTADLKRLTLMIERLRDADVLRDEDGAALSIEADRARELLQRGDRKGARGHVDTLASLTDELIRAEALTMADGRAVIEAARELLVSLSDEAVRRIPHHSSRQNQEDRQMFRKSALGILCAGLAMAALGFARPANAQTDLIVNGSFQSPDVGFGWDVYGSIAGWTTVSGPGIEVGHVGLYDISGTDGDQVCELDSHGNTRIRQTVATTAGRIYTLKFRTAERGFTDDASNQVNVYWNGALLASINPTWTAMAEHTFLVTATGASSDLDFAGGGTSDSLGSMIDAVSLVEIQPKNLCLLYDPAKLHKSGSTIPIKLQLCGADGTNQSSSDIVLHAVQIVNVGSAGTGTPEDSGNANPDSDFRYDPTLGGTGGYIFNLSTKGLASGSYVVRFQVSGDPYTYEAGFKIR